MAVAEANQRRTQLDVDRYTPLAQQQAITQQDLDNATQNNMAAKAQVQAARAQVETAKAQITAADAAVQSAKAAVETAQINLGFTQVTSPIDGHSGHRAAAGRSAGESGQRRRSRRSRRSIRSRFISRSASRSISTFTRRFPTRRSAQADLRQSPDFELILADGTCIRRRAKFYFADRQVDVRTGAIRIAGLFPNPGNTLRPASTAEFGRRCGRSEGALLVPQRAVIDLQGTHQVASWAAPTR